MNCRLMVDPAAVPGDHVVFVAGDDEPAKAQVTTLLGEFGWPSQRVIDLGDLSAAGPMEMYVMLWVRMVPVMGGPMFNITVARPS
jgi:predicted dinucleotide-binding enzyme